MGGCAHVKFHHRRTVVDTTPVLLTRPAPVAAVIDLALYLKESNLLTAGADDAGMHVCR